MTCRFYEMSPDHPAICELDRRGPAIIMRSCKCLNNQSRCDKPEARDVEIAARNRPASFLARMARRESGR